MLILILRIQKITVVAESLLLRFFTARLLPWLPWQPCPGGHHLFGTAKSLNHFLISDTNLYLMLTQVNATHALSH